MLYEFHLEREWEEHSGYEEIRNRDFFEDEMESRRQNIKELIKANVRENLADQFLKILSSAYSIDCEYAIKLAYDLNLEQLDFLAIDGDVKGFEKEYFKQF